MVWFECTGGSSGGATSISLVNNCKIGVAANTVKQNPIDANNYVDISETSATLHRNNNNYNLWIYTPLLEAGKTYAIAWDSITGNDGNIYIDFTTSIPSSGDVTVTRLGNISSLGIIKGISVCPANDGYYGFPIWFNNTGNITITNPRIIEVD